MKGNGMSFVLGIESKNFSAYLEIRGATCSLAQSGLEDSGVRSGMFLDNLGVAQDAPCRLKKTNKQVMVSRRKQMDPLADPDGSCLGSGKFQVWFANCRWQSRLRGFSSRLVGGLLCVFASHWHYIQTLLLLAGRDAKSSCFQGWQLWSQVLSPAWFLCGEDSIKIKWEVRQTASVFLLRERPAQYFIFFPKAKHFFQFINFINWRIIVLQCCIGFWHTSSIESAIGIHEPSLLNLPPTPHPIPSLSVVTDSRFIFLCHTANSHWPSILHMVM